MIRNNDLFKCKLQISLKSFAWNYCRKTNNANKTMSNQKKDRDNVFIE